MELNLIEYILIIHSDVILKYWILGTISKHNVKRFPDMWRSQEIILKAQQSYHLEFPIITSLIQLLILRK